MVQPAIHTDIPQLLVVMAELEAIQEAPVTLTL